jgi:hypothetical protein
METISVQPVQSRKWYQIWWDVWKHPNVASFNSILNEPDHDPVRGFVWIGVISLIVGFLGSLVYYFVLGSQVAGAYARLCGSVVKLCSAQLQRLLG